MSRRINRPPTKVSKDAARSVSNIRRAQIDDAMVKTGVSNDDRPQGSIAHSPVFSKKASIISPIAQPTSSSHTDRMAPEIYSPLFQISNLNLPRDRITMNAWNRIFYDTHPIVRNAINLHASFPISKINITCQSKKVQQFFAEMAERIDLYSIVYGVALEFWKLGEVFPYAELDESSGVWNRISILNPDYVHVKKSIIGNQSLISLRPDAALKRVIQSTDPSDISIRQYIPAHIVDYVKKGQNIPLDAFNVSHLKLLSSPYDIRGTSIIVSTYKDLMLYDKLRESKFAQADGMINPLTLVKLGGNEYRPTQSDMEAFRQILEEAQYDKDFKLVTHADVQIERVGYGGGVMDISSDMEKITNNLYAGLMVPKSLMDQEGACVPVSNTEIYVQNKGWIFFDDLTDEDKIATLNPETQELEFHRPTFKKDYNFSGLMYSIKNDNVDFECTDFHEMYLSRDEGNTFQKERMILVFNKHNKLCKNKFQETVAFLKFKDDSFNKEIVSVNVSDVSVKYVENVRVFCVEVPNHVFVTRKNGHIAIHGNTYASSSVGLEVLRQRYDIFRNMIKKWIERKIFAPICEIQDFFEYKNGEKVLTVPSVDFNHLNLYDLNDYINSISQFVKDKQVSLQTLYRTLGLSYEEERRRLKEEAIDSAVFQKEQQILGGMRLSELQSLDAQKSIPEPPEVEPVSDDQGGGGGLPGMDSGPGGGDSGGGGGLLG